MEKIIMKVDGETFEVELNGNKAAEALKQMLPLSLGMSRWGDEYYGGLPGKIPAKDEMTDAFEVGEIAYWPPGNAFCIFFGPTPASMGDEPRMASPGILFGRIAAGNVKKLKAMAGSVSCSLEVL